MTQLKRRQWLSLSITAVLSLSLCACGGNSKELHRYIKKVKSRPSKQIEPIPSFKPIATHTYSSAHKRSPFKRLVINNNQSFQPDLNRVKEPLESYALDSLRMVGTLAKNHAMWALVQTPDGKVQPIKMGGYIGLNHGQIVSITGDEVKIVETVKGPNGWEKRPAALVLGSR